MTHYTEFTDRYSLEYGRLSFSLHFMTNICFELLPPQLLPGFSINNWSNPICVNIPNPCGKILVALLPFSLSHSPDLGCVGAQRIMYPGTFLV